MNLFIISNGFDREHDLSKSYIDFRNYLECEDWSYLSTLEAPFNCIPVSNRDLAEKCSVESLKIIFRR